MIFCIGLMCTSTLFQSIESDPFRSELRAWLKEKGVLVTGKPPEVARRILAVLDGTYVAPKSTGKKRSRAESLDGVVCLKP